MKKHLHSSKAATVVTASLLLLLLSLLPAALSFTNQAYAQTSSDHMTSDQSHVPTAQIGNRQVALDFKTTPATPLPGENVDMSLFLFDNSTSKAILHVTFILGITNEEGKQVFSEVVHGHDGTVNLRFIEDNSVPRYRVSANYDNLSASYISDVGSPIKVQGKVFLAPGNYNVAVEVIGIDHDSTSLQEPVKYNFILPVAPKQALPVKYQDRTFEVGAYSSMSITGAELFTEKKQLVIHSDHGNSTGDFKITLEIPKEMMSGPFSATYGDGSALEMQQTPGDNSTTLILTGKHAGHNTDSSVVISAANVVPEFPVASPVAAAGFASAVILYIRTYRLKSQGP
ncbi:MAG: hypothetical protein ABI347_09175 [Nitrososphaera sp.]